MLVYVAILALLFIDTVLANVCSNVYDKPAKILAASIELYKNYSCTHYEYVLKAPVSHYIALNFTHLYGFGVSNIPSEKWAPSTSSPTNYHSSSRSEKLNQLHLASCMPRLEIVQVLSTRKKKAMETICPEKNLVAPLVFQSDLPEVIVTYSWDPGTNSTMVLSFSFYKKSGSRVIELVVIVLAVVVVLLIICCVFSHYRFTSHVLRHHRHNSPPDSLDPGGQFQSEHCTHRSHEVVYVPQSSHDRVHRTAQSHQPSSTSSHDEVDTTNLPPQIPISLDGEEGYQNSQRLLQTSSVSHEVVNPPPNRTVFQGESPPPYRAHSVGQLDKSRINRSRAGRDCKSSPCVPYSHPTSSSAGGTMNHINGGSSNTYSSHSNRDSSSNYTPSHGVATNGHLYNNNHHHKDGNSSHITFFSGGGTPVVVERKLYHQGAPTSATSNPRSVRIFSDPSSSSSALVVGHHLRTVSGSTSSNSSTGPGNQGPPPTYCDLSDTEVFDVLTRPNPSEAS